MTTTLLRRGRVDAPAAPGATAMLLVSGTDSGTVGGTVGWVGRVADAPAADRTVELSGALVTPVFVDAHVHATQTGLALTGLDLSGARSLAEALAAVERQGSRQPGPVLLGAGWDETRWPERRPPTPAELDRACPGGLVYLARVDHHSAVVSPALLAACPQARELAAHHAVRAAAFAGVTPTQQAAAPAIAEHVAACTRAGVQAGFHAIGDRALRAFDAYWGGADGMYAQRLGADRAAALNPFAGFAAASVPLAFGSDAPVTPLDPWGGVRAAAWHHTPGSRLSPRAAFTAATLGGWRAARRAGEGVLRPGAPASYAVWDVEVYSADGLPDLSPGRPLPVCRQTVVRGVTVYER
jgi:predicted amidohydrolase YtcJ